MLIPSKIYKCEYCNKDFVEVAPSEKSANMAAQSKLLSHYTKCKVKLREDRLKKLLNDNSQSENT